ncbi:hypothetical protein WJX81_008658 [Elliptochloris bilobata]|uniref:Uncharacterized protein n=1 Tax=Elliptochloris bilobata TaxID=381761 RepID=A0AAW1QDU4_9CHLO
MSDDPVAKRARTEAVAEPEDGAGAEADGAATEAPGAPEGEIELANGGQEPVEAPSEDDEDADKVDRAIAGLREVQEELEQVNDEASMKVLEVEMEYNQRRKPVFEKRNRLIRDIDQFWLNVFLQHPHLNACLRGDDTEALACLEEVDISDSPDIKSGFTVTFRFMEGNVLFQNQELRKEYRFMEDGRLMVTGTAVEWLQELAEEEQPGPSGRMLVERGESFFTWFDPPEQSEPLGVEIDSIAEVLKDDIWPNPMKFFTGDLGLPLGVPGNPIDLEVEEYDDDEYEAEEEFEPDDVGEVDLQYDEDEGNGCADEDEEAQALAQEQADLAAAEAAAEAQGEEDAEVAFVDPGSADDGGDAPAGGGDARAAPDPGGEEEEYYDDEGADHDREDDEE